MERLNTVWWEEEEELAGWRSGWNEPYNITQDGKVILKYKDSLVVPILSWIIIGTYTIALLALTPLIIYRRNKQPIKARNYILMLILMYSHYLALLSTTLRLGVGRWRYPCLFYSPVFSLLVPCAFLPSILRMWRLFFVFRLSKIKIRLAGFKQQQQHSNTTTNINEKIDLELQEKVRTKATVVKSRIGRRSVPNRGFRDQLDHALFKLQTIWVSNGFMLSVILAIFMVHAVMWIIILFTAWSAKDVFQMRFSCESTLSLTIILGVQIFFYLAVELVLLLLLYIFKVNDKWGVRLEVTVSLSQMIIFLGVAVILTALNDSVYVEGERYWPAIFFGLIAFFIDLIWVNIVPLIQSFNPENNRTNVEKDDTNDQNSFSLIQVLDDDEFRFLYKQFCAASLVVEPICFYEDNKSFSEPGKTNNGQLLFEAKQIIEKYCLDYSPLLLNMENKEALIKPIQEQIEAYETKLVLLQDQTATHYNQTVVEERWVDPNLFHSINIASLHDMQADTFPRFKKSKTYSQYIKNLKKMKKSKETVGDDEELN